MKWADLRHAYYLTSADFMALLSLLHVLTLTLTGYGVLRSSKDINDIQDNVWALVACTALFTVSLLGSRRSGGGKTYGRVHKYLLPLFLLVSLVSLITLSAYHGIIIVLALHLVLVSFVLTGFPCVLLILINLTGISVGTMFQVVLVRKLYGQYEDGLVEDKLGELARNYGYGLATKSSIVLVDMGLLFLQVIGGLVFYSRFFKLGLLMASWKSNPSLHMNEFSLLIKLERLIFGRYIYDEPSEHVAKSLKKRLLSSAIHSSSFPGDDDPTTTNNSSTIKGSNRAAIISSNAGSNRTTTSGKGSSEDGTYQPLKAVGSSAAVGSGSLKHKISFKDIEPTTTTTTTTTITPINRSGTSGYNPFEVKNKIVTIDSYNELTREELRDPEWLKFLRSSGHEVPTGRRTYSAERILLNPLIDGDRMGLSSDGDKMGVSSEGEDELLGLEPPAVEAAEGLRGKSETLYEMVSTTINSSNYTISPNITNSNSIPSSKNNSIGANNSSIGANSSSIGATNISRICTNEDEDVTPLDKFMLGGGEEEEIYRQLKVEASMIHSRAMASTYRDGDDRLFHLKAKIHNPLLKLVYLLMPRCLKGPMDRAMSSVSKLNYKRELIYTLRWRGATTLPQLDFMQLFAHEPYERLYVKWMHSFNTCFYSATLFETVTIIFYSLMGSILLCYRHYLTLSQQDKDAFMGSINRLVILALRFILYPIISLVIIILTLLILSHHSNQQGANSSTNSSTNSGTNNGTTTVGSRAGELSVMGSKGPSITPIGSNTHGNEGTNTNDGKKKSGKEGDGVRRKKFRERITSLYWVMLLLCIVDFAGSLFDVFISLGLETPPYAVHNSLSMQFLLTKTAAFLLVRFPTLFLLYLVYFIGLFTCQFFLKHTSTIRYLTMQVWCEVVIGIGSFCFLMKPIDVNRRRIFAEIVLPYVLYLSKFIKGPGMGGQTRSISR